MFNTIYDEVTHLITKKRGYASQDIIERNVISLLMLKYLCDEGIYNYKEIIALDNLENEEFKYDNYLLHFDDYKIIKLLPLIEYEDINSLIKEYLNFYKNSVYNFGINEKRVCVSTYFTSDIYDPTGNTIYVINQFGYSTKVNLWFKFFDKVLKVNNEYLDKTELDITKYKVLYVHDFLPKYRFVRNSNNDVYEYIRKAFTKNESLTIILHTSYKKISNMNEAWYLLNDLKTVVLFDDNNTFLYFNSINDNNVSIVNYENIKDKSLTKLINVIKQNRRQKDVLIKTTHDEIKKNHYRLGFKLYQNQTPPDITNINDIVAENTRLIGRLSDLNKQIEIEIDKLINR